MSRTAQVNNISNAIYLIQTFVVNISVFIFQMETAQPARMCGSMIVTGETTRTGNGTFETLHLTSIFQLFVANL